MRVRAPQAGRGVGGERAPQGVVVPAALLLPAMPEQQPTTLPSHYCPLPPPQVSARVLLELARQALPVVPDSGMHRDLKSLLDRLHARCRQHGLPAEPLTPEEIGELLQE